MPKIKSNIIKIDKIKKDGSIDAEIFSNLVSSLLNNDLIILPVDCIYYSVGIFNESNRGKLKRIFPDNNSFKDNLVLLISNFKMLDEVVLVNKFSFDFLHRIWPGDVEVKFEKLKNKNSSIKVRMPSSKFLLNIIEKISLPLIIHPLYDIKDDIIIKERNILKKYSGKVSTVFIVKEYCREFTHPTCIEIVNNDISFIQEGKVSIEEIKSLFFLDENSFD